MGRRGHEPIGYSWGGSSAGKTPAVLEDGILAMIRMNEKVMIMVVPFWMDLGSSIFYLAAPLAAIELGGNPIELGLIGTISASVYVTLAGVVGRLSDRLGRRVLIFAGPLLFSMTCLLMTQVADVKGILFLAGLNGLSVALFWAPFQAWVAESQSGLGLARNIGNFNMSWTASHLVGPVLAGFLFGLHSRMPFWLAFVLSFALCLVIRASVSDRDRPPEKEDLPAPAAAREADPDLTFLYAIWIANFASWFILGNIRYQFPKLARDLAMAPEVIGVLMGCVGLAQFLGFFALRGTDRWHFKRSYLLGAQSLAATALLLILLSSHKLIFASAFFLIGLCGSVTYYSSLYYAVRLLEKKGKGTGLHESILAGGVVLGPILGGIAAHSMGLRMPYLLCLLVLLGGVAAEWALLRRKTSSFRYS